MKLPNMITEMDKNALRSILFLLFMLGLVVGIIFIGRTYVQADDTDIANILESFSNSPWALFIVVLLFVGGAFIGVPQWALFAAVIAVFGPASGALYSWLATLVSSSVTFFLGRLMGQERLENFAGDMTSRIMTLVRRNGFLMSMAVRLVPTGPFILVNMAAGVSGMSYLAFIGGTAIGIIPKIAVVALIAEGILSGAQGEYMKLGFIALAAIFLGATILLRKKLRSVMVYNDKIDD